MKLDLKIAVKNDPECKISNIFIKEEKINHELYEKIIKAVNYYNVKNKKESIQREFIVYNEGLFYQIKTYIKEYSKEENTEFYLKNLEKSFKDINDILEKIIIENSTDQ